MRALLMKCPTLVLGVFLVFSTLLVPIQGATQGRGHGQSKKVSKFINGHDARNGRWDGRGPRPRLARVRWHRRHHHDRIEARRRLHKDRRILIRRLR